ncbi:hypothetical protein LTR78_010331, partial [Recurvomyces mirabilis]
MSSFINSSGSESGSGSGSGRKHNTTTTTVSTNNNTSDSRRTQQASYFRAAPPLPDEEVYSDLDGFHSSAFGPADMAFLRAMESPPLRERGRERGYPVSCQRHHAEGGVETGGDDSVAVPDIVVTGADASDNAEAWRMHSVSFTPRAPPPTREGLSRAVSPAHDGESDSLPPPRFHDTRLPGAHTTAAHAPARYTVVRTVATPPRSESDNSDDEPPPLPSDLRIAESTLTAAATAQALRRTGPPPIWAHHHDHPARAYGPRPPLPTSLEAAALAARAPRADVEPEAPDEDAQLNEADLLRAIGPEHWEDGLFFFDSSGNIHARSQQPTQRGTQLPRPSGRGFFGYEPPPSPTLQRGEEDGRLLPRRRSAVAGLDQLPPEVQRFLRDGEADRFVLTEEE